MIVYIREYKTPNNNVTDLKTGIDVHFIIRKPKIFSKFESFEFMTHFVTSQHLKFKKNREKSLKFSYNTDKQRTFPKILYRYTLNGQNNFKIRK